MQIVRIDAHILARKAGGENKAGERRREIFVLFDLQFRGRVEYFLVDELERSNGLHSKKPIPSRQLERSVPHVVYNNNKNKIKSMRLLALASHRSGPPLSPSFFHFGFFLSIFIFDWLIIASST